MVSGMTMQGSRGRNYPRAARYWSASRRRLILPRSFATISGTIHTSRGNCHSLKECRQKRSSAAAIEILTGDAEDRLFTAELRWHAEDDGLTNA